MSRMLPTVPAPFDPESFSAPPTSAPAAYQGHDRRSLVAAAPFTRTRPFVVGGLLLLIAWAVVGLLASPAVQSASIDFDLLYLALATATVAVAAFAGVLCIVYWHLVGAARAVWLGAALLVFGVATVGFGEVLATTGLVGTETGVLGWLRPASVVVVLCLFGMAVRSPDVDARLNARRIMVLSFGAVSALTLALQLVPPLSAAVSGSAELVPPSARSVWAAGAVGLVWLTLATVLAVHGWRHDRKLFLWMSTLMFGLTLSEITRALDTITEGDWLTGAALLRAVAVSLGLIGITRQLQSIFAVQTERLFHTRAQSLVHEARIRHHLAEQEERAHEARNALAAIEAAVVTLERHRERLDDISQRSLSRAVSSEIAHLQRLVSFGDARPVYRIVFDPNEVIRAQVELARSQGVNVAMDLQPSLAAYGRPANVAEALQNVLVNARTHAPGSPVAVQARQEDDWVVIRVVDDGPGVQEHQRGHIFTRGGRASTAPGSGLGLYVSRQLMRDQGGDLSFEETDAGACFALKVAEASAAASADGFRALRADGVDHPLDRHDVVENDVPFADTGTESADSRTGRRVGQAHQDVDGDALR